MKASASATTRAAVSDRFLPLDGDAHVALLVGLRLFSSVAASVAPTSPLAGAAACPPRRRSTAAP